MDAKVSINDMGNQGSPEEVPEKREFIIQICFGGNADLELIEKQLDNVINDIDLSLEFNKVRFICGFLHRKHVEQKNFNTAIVDLLENKLGDKLIFATEKYDTFEEVMENMPEIRKEMAFKADQILVFGLNDINKGVAEEVALVSDHRVILV